MGYLNIAPNLFLEVAELNRFQKFLGTDGWRRFCLQNSVKFGVVKNKEDNTWENGQIVQGSTLLTIKNKELFAIDEDGLVIYRPETDNIVVPNDGAWYWVKVYHEYSSIEEGTVSIDMDGNLTGIGTKFTEVLRGQPNFPAKIKFTDSLLNVLEYEVLEVVSDTLAVLNGSNLWVAEGTIHYSVVGTFTPGYVPLVSEKYPFRYDSCNFSLVAESILNTRPTAIDNKIFYLARVRVSGGNLEIQDKRTEVFKSNALWYVDNHTEAENPLLGVEKIVYDHLYSTKENNIVYTSWCFRSDNWTINTNIRQLTLNGGEGGKFKTTTDFTNNDFNGWRVYTENGKYSKVISSTKSGSQINLILDWLDPDNYIDSTQKILITPDAEEVQLIFKSASLPDSTSFSDLGTETPDLVFTFPINTDLAGCKLLAYLNEFSYYNLKYRYKSHNSYSEVFLPSSDSVGYYTETSFDANGILNENIIDRERFPYTSDSESGYIRLRINPDAYKLVIDNLDKGDLNGVEHIFLDGSSSEIELVVGRNRKFIRFQDTNAVRTSGVAVHTSPLTLNQNLFIILPKTRVDGTSCVNGNQFNLTIFRAINLNGYTMKIVTDYEDTVTYTLLKQITQRDLDYIKLLDRGFSLDFIFTDTTWVYRRINDTLVTINSDWNLAGKISLDTSVDPDISGYYDFGIIYNPLLNRVEFRGAIQVTGLLTSTNVIGTLTSDYRPSETVAFPIYGTDSGNIVAYICRVTSAGVVTIETNGTTDLLTPYIFDNGGFYL